MELDFEALSAWARERQVEPVSAPEIPELLRLPADPTLEEILRVLTQLHRTPLPVRVFAAVIDSLVVPVERGLCLQGLRTTTQRQQLAQTQDNIRALRVLLAEHFSELAAPSTVSVEEVLEAHADVVIRRCAVSSERLRRERVLRNMNPFI